MDLTLLLRDEIRNIYGKYPHVVINELARIKLDANRDIDEAAFGVETMKAAWETVSQSHVMLSQRGGHVLC